MRILALGDVIGRSGREAIIKATPQIRRKFEIDFVVVNAENATQGRGITLAHAQKLLAAEVDCITLGDHAFDQRCLIKDIDSDNRIIRPINFAKSAPGKGAGLYSDAKGQKILVISALGRVFMQPTFDDPFSMVQNILNKYPLGSSMSAIILDFHAEATSEKNAMGLFCDGRVSAVVGTHTHIPTADDRILNNGTAYITDLGMTGDYNSIIGMEKEEPLNRFINGMTKSRFVPASGEATVSGVIVETDDTTGLSKSIITIRLDGDLSQK